MFRFLRIAAVCAALCLCCACAARGGGAPASPEAPSAVASAPSAASAPPVSSAPPEPAAPPPLEVSSGDDLRRIPAGGEAETTFSVASMGELPLPDPEANASCTVLLEGEPVFSGAAAELADFQPPRNGRYEYRVLVRDGSEPAEYRFFADCALPPEVRPASTHVKLGEVLPITARYADGLDLAAESDLGFSPRFFPDGDAQTALLPVRYSLTPGAYHLTVAAGDLTFRYELSVDDRAFEVQHLTIDESTVEDTAGSADANAEWERKLEPLKPVSDPTRYWEGPFLMPAQGPISTEFGMIRYTNDDPTPSRDGGIDIAAKEGSPVLAAGAGRVLFADRIQLTGNTVLIEHGLGLKSWYYHMNSLNVAAGDMVEQGQQIGAVGSTGFSTGPHLHFAMSVNNVFVNPWTAIETGISG